MGLMKWLSGYTIVLTCHICHCHLSPKHLLLCPRLSLCLCFLFTKLTRPFVLHVHITSYWLIGFYLICQLVRILNQGSFSYKLGKAQNFSCDRKSANISICLQHKKGFTHLICNPLV